MTLIETTALLFPLMGGVLGARAGAAWATGEGSALLLGGGLGALGGGLAGLAAHVLLWGGLLALGRFIEWWRPDRPLCRQGRCGAFLDYTSLEEQNPTLAPDDRQLAERVRREGHGPLVRCQCGDRYVDDRARRQFLQVSPEGELLPYRYHRPLGRTWLPARSG